MINLKVSKSVFPNTFTCLNVFSGFLSIVMASQNEIFYASYLIAAAAVFDALDGIVARFTGSSSKFGVELDSLADVVSFGAAPAFLIYASYLKDLGWIGIVVSSFQLVMGALRLARFNTDLKGFDKTYFSGLPIPFAALTIASFLIFHYDESAGFSPLMEAFVVPLVISLGLLMVSKIKFDTLPKFTSDEIRNKPVYHVFTVIAFLTVLISKGSLLFFILVSVIVFSIIRYIKNFFFNGPDENIGLNNETH